MKKLVVLLIIVSLSLVFSGCIKSTEITTGCKLSQDWHNIDCTQQACSYTCSDECKIKGSATITSTDLASKLKLQFKYLSSTSYGSSTNYDKPSFMDIDGDNKLELFVYDSNYGYSLSSSSIVQQPFSAPDTSPIFFYTSTNSNKITYFFIRYNTNNYRPYKNIFEYNNYELNFHDSNCAMPYTTCINNKVQFRSFSSGYRLNNYPILLDENLDSNFDIYTFSQRLGVSSTDMAGFVALPFKTYNDYCIFKSGNRIAIKESSDCRITTTIYNFYTFLINEIDIPSTVPSSYPCGLNEVCTSSGYNLDYNLCVGSAGEYCDGASSTLSVTTPNTYTTGIIELTAGQTVSFNPMGDGSPINSRLISAQDYDCVCNQLSFPATCTQGQWYCTQQAGQDAMQRCDTLGYPTGHNVQCNALGTITPCDPSQKCILSSGGTGYGLGGCGCTSTNQCLAGQTKVGTAGDRSYIKCDTSGICPIWSSVNSFCAEGLVYDTTLKKCILPTSNACQGGQKRCTSALSLTYTNCDYVSITDSYFGTVSGYQWASTTSTCSGEEVCIDVSGNFDRCDCNNLCSTTDIRCLTTATYEKCESIASPNSCLKFRAIAYPVSAGYYCSTNQLVKISGCRWDNTICKVDQTCQYIDSNPVDSGICVCKTELDNVANWCAQGEPDECILKNTLSKNVCTKSVLGSGNCYAWNQTPCPAQTKCSSGSCTSVGCAYNTPGYMCSTQVDERGTQVEICSSNQCVAVQDEYSATAFDYTNGITKCIDNTVYEVTRYIGNVIPIYRWEIQQACGNQVCREV